MFLVKVDLISPWVCIWLSICIQYSIRIILHNPSLIWPLIPSIFSTHCPFLQIIVDSVSTETNHFAGNETDIFWILQFGNLTHTFTFSTILTATAHQCLIWNSCACPELSCRDQFSPYGYLLWAAGSQSYLSHFSFWEYLNVPYLYNLFKHTLLPFHNVCVCTMDLVNFRK